MILNITRICFKNMALRAAKLRYPNQAAPAPQRTNPGLPPLQCGVSICAHPPHSAELGRPLAHESPPPYAAPHPLTATEFAERTEHEPGLAPTKGGRRHWREALEICS